MFEKFNDIRKASAEKYANSGTGRGVTIGQLHDKLSLETNVGNRRKVVYLIDALSKEDQAELTGIVMFGRDYEVEKGSTHTVLSSAIQDHAHMVNQTGHSGYLAGKPLHIYLERAEAKLTGKQLDRLPILEDE
jgi:hypothetical protein